MRRKRDHVIGKTRTSLPIAFRGDADAIRRLDNDLLRGQKADHAGCREVVSPIVGFRYPTLSNSLDWTCIRRRLKCA